jgi:UDP-N-acetylmuramoylalanine--D-glutamate ligase
VKERVKTLVLIGEASEKIRQALGDVTETVTAPDLKGAVDVARERARPGEVVLLSPACASFDMFRDFEDRGAQFKKIVRELR